MRNDKNKVDDLVKEVLDNKKLIGRFQDQMTQSHMKFVEQLKNEGILKKPEYGLAMLGDIAQYCPDDDLIGQ